MPVCVEVYVPLSANVGAGYDWFNGSNEASPEYVPNALLLNKFVKLTGIDYNRISILLLATTNSFQSAQPTFATVERGLKTEADTSIESAPRHSAAVFKDRIVDFAASLLLQVGRDEEGKAICKGS